MKVAKSEAVKLLVGVGIKNAGAMKLDALQDKLGAMGKLTENQLKKLDKDSVNLYKAVRSAIKDEKDITVEADKESKKAKAAKAAADEESDDDDDEESDEEEESEGDDEEDDESEESDEEESEDSDEEGEDDDSEDTEEEDEEVTEKKKTKKGDKSKKDKGKKDKPKKPKKESAPRDRFGMREGTRAARLNKAITAKAKTIQQIMKDAKYDKPIHGHMNKLVNDGYVTKVKMKDGSAGYKETGKKYKPE